MGILPAENEGRIQIMNYDWWWTDEDFCCSLTKSGSFSIINHSELSQWEQCSNSFHWLWDIIFPHLSHLYIPDGALATIQHLSFCNKSFAIWFKYFKNN